MCDTPVELKTIPWDRSLDRSSFDCGKQFLNDWLNNRASQFVKRGQARLHCVLYQDTAKIAGFYALSSHTVEIHRLPKKEQRGLCKGIPVPSVLIGQLAVDAKAQGRGVGEFLLFDALRRIVAISNELGVRLIQVRALDDQARGFYVKYGFLSLVDNQRDLFLKVATAEKLFTD